MCGAEGAFLLVGLLSFSAGSKGKGKADEKDKGGKKADKPEPGSLLEPGAHQSLAVLGIALIAMGEEIGAEMALRSINHLVSKPDAHSVSF